MGPATEPEPVTFPAVVPDEAVQATLRAYPAWVDEEDVRDIFVTAAEASWVLVRGPVHTEWATAIPGGGLPSVWASEAQARRVSDGVIPVVCRQVTGWRPAEFTQDGERG